MVGSVLVSLAFIFGGHTDVTNAPTAATVRTLFSGFLVFIVVGIVLVAFGLPPPYGNPPRAVTTAGKDGVQQVPSICGTLRLLREPRMYMLVPLLMSSGLLSGFVTADYTRSVVVPAVGYDSIGWVLAINGASGAMAFLLLGRLADLLGRVVVSQ